MSRTFFEIRHSRQRPDWLAGGERIRTRRCHAQTGPLTCRKKLARLPEHLVTRDFSRESCQPSTRHCELRCARDVGFEPVSAAVFWIFRFRKANVPQLHNRTVACATALAAVTRSLRRTRSWGLARCL